MLTKFSLLYEFKGRNKHRGIDYLIRIDPLTGNVAKISEERAKRSSGINMQSDINPVKNCDFCNYRSSTPQPHILHQCGAVSFPNKFSWEKYDWITAYPPFNGHKLLLSDIYFEDMEMMIESSFDLASMISHDNEVIAFMDFTNWGVFAGASQQHPHSQRKSITFCLDPTQARELEKCKAIYEKTERCLFDLLREEELCKGERIVYVGDVVILSAFAPSSPDELLIFPKESISHILQTSQYERKLIADPVVGVFPALFFYRGVSDVNIAFHMAPFREMESARKYYRWHMHIYPRRNRLPVDKAGAEIAYSTSVIDVTPETTAYLIRSWYNEGPRRELVLRQKDGKPNIALLEIFDKVIRRS